jgi:hypothetical protein
VKCAVELNVLAKEVAHVESWEGETCPRALIPLQPGHYRFSLIAAFKRDGPEWCTSKGFGAAQSVIPGYRIVYVCIVLYFSFSNTVSWK